jgi:hypothetical protein
MTSATIGHVGRYQRRLRFNLGTYVPLLLALGLRVASEPTASLSYLALAAYALAGRSHALRALAMSWLFTFINRGLAPEATNAAIMRYVVLAAAALSMLLRARQSKKASGGGMLLATMLLGLLFVLHSFLFSPIVDVSVMKALSWTAVMATILSGWNGLTPSARDTLVAELFGLLGLILLVSLPLISREIGYMRNGTGFQGVLNHPQAFGSSMAMLGSWGLARLLVERRGLAVAIGLLAACIYAVLASESRTAGLALALGCLFSLVAQACFGRLGVRRLVPGLYNPLVWFAFLMTLIAGLVLAPMIVDRVEHFISKSGRQESGSVLEAYETSRGFLIDQMNQNIADRPFFGIGFGIASDPADMDVARDPILNLPVGAAIEKGVLPLAIVEELGIVISILFGAWVFRLMWIAGRGGLVPSTVVTTALITNFGEATFFSAGGFGLILLLFIGWGCVSGRQSRDTLGNV